MAPNLGALLRRPWRPTVWQRRMLLVWNLNNSAYATVDFLVTLRHYGFGAVCVKTHDGFHAFSGAHGDNLDPANFARLRKAGLTVGIWGWNGGSPGGPLGWQTDPVAEARLVAAQVAQFGASFYVADAEAGYEFSPRDSPTFHAGNQRYVRSAAFVREFRRHCPKLPAALTSYGRTSLHDLDWQAWIHGGFRWLPQAYMNESDALTPALCVRDGARLWPAGQTHPMVASYRGALGQTRPEWIAAALVEAGALGFSVYAADEGFDPGYASVLGACRAAV